MFGQRSVIPLRLPASASGTLTAPCALGLKFFTVAEPGCPFSRQTPLFFSVFFVRTFFYFFFFSLFSHVSFYYSYGRPLTQTRKEAPCVPRVLSLIAASFYNCSMSFFEVNCDPRPFFFFSSGGDLSS